MVIERDLQVMNFDAVGEAYVIAANYLRRSGALSGDGAETKDHRLLEIVVGLYYGGEHNRIKLANKAIARFQADS
jgi:hypothetical protein